MGKFQDLLCSEPAFRIFVNSSEYKFHLAPPDAASPHSPTLPLAAQICPPPRLSWLLAKIQKRNTKIQRHAHLALLKFGHPHPFEGKDRSWFTQYIYIK